jgi:uncharacterized tellurite resistance protein B-like protein
MLDIPPPACESNAQRARRSLLMLKEITTFFAELTGGDKHLSQFGDGDYRRAAAALLVHVATSDGDLTAAGRDKLHALLKDRFDLDDTATAELIAAATAADRAAIDLYHFTSLINRSLDDDGRRRLIAMMWEMAYVDGRVSEFEDNILWRVADLINVPQRERIDIRRRVAEERARLNDDA